MISTITLDTYKQQISSGDAFNLSDSFNGRVGDEQVPLAVHFKERGLAHRFEDGLVPFLTGFVGSLDENNQVTAETGEAVSYVGTSDDIVGLGRVKMNLPGTMFPQEGFFYGFLGLQNADGKRVTTFNVWFHVYNGNPDMFVNKAPFRTELQKLLDTVQLLIDDADGDLNKWKQKLTDLFTTLSAQGADTATLLTTLETKIKQNGLFTQAEMDALLGSLTSFKAKGTTLAAKLANEFSDRQINVRWYGVQADGATDDADALQAMFDGLNEPTHIVFPQNSFVIVSKPIVVKCSDLTIDFNGATLVYTGTSALGRSNGTDRYYGALMFVGNVEDTYHQIDSITQYKGFVVPADTLNQTGYKGQTTPPDQASELTLASGVTNDFEIGDYVEVTIKNYDGAYSQAYADNPAELNGILSKVVAVDGQKVYVDFASDFIFDDIKVATIRKVTPIENIVVNDFRFEDRNETAIPTMPTSTDFAAWVSGLKFIRCANVRVNDFRATKHRFPALSMWQVHDYVITDAKASDARYLGPGCGYLMQLMSTTHGVINNAHGRNIRHLVDLSASGHVVVKDCQMPNNWLNAFDCHGTGEFDITYENCVGNFLFGNNIDEFPNMTASVRMIDCQGSVTANWLYKLSVVNSTLRLFNFETIQRIVQLTVTSSTLTAQDNVTKLFASSRGSYTASFVQLSDSSIVYDAQSVAGDGSAIRIEGYNRVQFGDLPNVLNNSTSFQLIQFLRCSDVTLSNIGLMRNVGLYINNLTTAGTETVTDTRSEGGVLTINNVNFDNKLTNTAAVSFVNVDGMDNVTKYTINYVGNNFGAKTETRWLRVNTTFVAVVNADTNVLRGKVSGYLSAGVAPVLRSSNNVDQSSLNTGLKMTSFRSGLAVAEGAQGVTFRFPDDKIQYDTNYVVQVTPTFNAGAIWAHDKTTGEVQINWETGAPKDAYLNIAITQ